MVWVISVKWCVGQSSNAQSHPNLSPELHCLNLQVVDSAVLRFPRAVTHFSPGSHQYRPRQRTSLSNGYMAGDWVKGVDHGANGLSQVCC